MITSHIRNWGISLAIRFPQAILSQLELSADSEVEIQIKDGKLIISPVKTPVYTLEELLGRVSTENLHEEIDTGKPAGSEVW